MEQVVYLNFAYLLNTLRGDMTYNEFADKIGCSAYSLHAWTTKSKLPTLANLESISNYMGIDLISLIKIIMPDKGNQVTVESITLEIKHFLSYSDKIQLLVLLSQIIEEDSLNQNVCA